MDKKRSKGKEEKTGKKDALKWGRWRGTGERYSKEKGERRTWKGRESRKERIRNVGGKK